MSKHTLGKWKISHHDDDDNLVIRADDGRIIANLEIDRHMMDDDEIAANARLIAAAPDLLEALQEMDVAYRDALIDKKGCPCLRCNDASIKAQEAIAKATT